MKNKSSGFLTLIGLLITMVIIAMWFYLYSNKTQKIHNTENNNFDIQTGTPTITEARNDIQKAEDVKKLVESKYENLEDF